MKNIISQNRCKSMLRTLLGRMSLLCVFGLITVLAALPGYSQGAEGYSYIFPGATQATTIVLGNINPQSVSVTVAFYGTGGNISSDTVQLAPGAQTRVDPTAVSLTTFQGSVVVTSPLPLAASAISSNGTNPFDYVPPAQQGNYLVVPFAPADTGTVLLNVFNPGINQAIVKATLVKTDGTEVSTVSATLNPDNTTTMSLGASPGATHVYVRSTSLFGGDRPVAVSAFINNFTPGVAGAIQRTDFAIVPATPVGTSLSTTIPYFAQGDDYFNIVEAVNVSNNEQTMILTAYNADGTLVTGTNNPATVVVPTFGSTRLNFTDMFITSSTSLITGYITVTSTGAVIAADAIGDVSRPSFAVITSEDKGQTTFAYQLRLTGREIFNEMSFLNPNGQDATLAMTFLDDAGDNVSNVSITVPHGQAIIDTLADLFPEAQGNGYILFQSSQPIISSELDGRVDPTAALQVLQASLALGALPIAYASPSFVPPPQTEYLAVGTVRDTNPGTVGAVTGEPNVAISLNGPVQLTTLTDQAGTYVFNDLTPGTYTITPIPIGYTVTPTCNRTFKITNANSRKDDFVIGLTPPTLTFISPDSALVGSGSVTIAIQGVNFTQNSVVAFQDTEVPTTFVDVQDLTATIPGSLLTTTGNIQLFIRNKGASGDYLLSNPLIFVVGTAGPTLTSVTGFPTPLITGTITAPFTITVMGNGFNPASQVKINLVGRPTIYVSQYEVQALIQPSDVNIVPGPIPVVVQNPLGVESAPYQLQILYPQPTITSISPNTITAEVALQAQPLTLTVTGTNFSVNYSQCQRYCGGSGQWHGGYYAICFVNAPHCDGAVGFGSAIRYRSDIGDESRAGACAVELGAALYLESSSDYQQSPGWTHQFQQFGDQ